jgi:hypothetical protein
LVGVILARLDFIKPLDPSMEICNNIWNGYNQADIGPRIETIFGSNS